MAGGYFEVQTALVAALKAADVAGDRIYDAANVSPSVTFPYVAIGPSDFTSDTPVGSEGSVETFTLQVWDRNYRGAKQVKDVMAAIKGALDGAVLTATGRDSAHAFVSGGQTFLESDGLTVRGIVRVTVHHYASVEA